MDTINIANIALQIMGLGMMGIFTAMVVIMVITLILQTFDTHTTSTP